MNFKYFTFLYFGFAMIYIYIFAMINLSSIRIIWSCRGHQIRWIRQIDGRFQCCDLIRFFKFDFFQVFLQPISEEFHIKLFLLRLCGKVVTARMTNYSRLFEDMSQRLAHLWRNDFVGITENMQRWPQNGFFVIVRMGQTAWTETRC